MKEEGIIHTQGDVSYISYPLLEKYHVLNAFSLKGLNFKNQAGMEEEYQKFLACLNVPYRNLVKPLQKHTNHVIVVEKKENEETADIHLDYLDGVDGIITNQKNIALATTSADCLCIVLYDTQKHVLANLHSGWRGTFQKIAQKAVQKMKETYQCNPADIIAFLMPAIRQCHFEVEEDVMQLCREAFASFCSLDEGIIQVGRKVDGVQKYQIDTIRLNQIMLEQEGILSQNIYDSGMCSVCHQDCIHSRRAEGETFGLGTTIVMMQ